MDISGCYLSLKKIIMKDLNVINKENIRHTKSLKDIYKKRHEMDSLFGVGTAYHIITKIEIPLIRHLRSLLN